MDVIFRTCVLFKFDPSSQCG